MSDENVKKDKGYRSTPADKRRARILGVVYIVLAVFLAWMLFKIWPPTPWPFVNTEQAKAFSQAECSSPTTAAAAQTSTQPSATTSSTPTPAPTATPAQQPTQTGVTGANTGAQTSVTRGAATPTPTPTPTPEASPTPSQDLAAIPISFFWGRWCYRTTFDERLIMLVIVAGMLGSFVHGATSLADYIGNNKFNKRWTWFYLLRPSIGMALALVFYFVIRGGFLTTTGGAKDINPYGIAALAGLVGMFSKQATDKLSEVFGTLFRAAAGQGDDARTGSLTSDGAAAAVAITSVSPDSGPAAGGTTVTITGAGFAVGPPQPSVTFGDGSATITEMDATKIVVTTPPNATGAVDVVITNADGTQAVKEAGYTYE